MPPADADLALLSDPRLVAARRAHVSRLERIFGSETPERPFVLWGVPGRGQVDPYSQPGRWVEEALADLVGKAEALADARVFRPLVVEYGIYGVHFIDKLFGAEVFDLDGSGNWQARCLDSPVGRLRMPEIEQDPTWRLAREAAEAFVRSGATVPLFGLPTLSSALNVAVNLYGERILTAMLEEPAAAHRDLRIINNVICRLHRWYLATVPGEQLQPVVATQRTQPPGYGQLCGCTSHLLSARQYRGFIAPLDDALLLVYPNGGMIHLCGVHTQHLPVWRGMASLRAVQLNDRAAENLEAYFSGLRGDQMIYVNPCEAMPVERVLTITGGRRVVVVAGAASVGRPR